MALANALGHLGRTDAAKDTLTRAQRANPRMTPQHLAKQIKIAASCDQAHADRALAGLKVAGLL